jgi:hypothetical protein
VTVSRDPAIRLPDDFGGPAEDPDVARADGLIVQLLQARQEIRDPELARSAPGARALVDRLWRSAVPFGTAAHSLQVRHEMMVHLLDQGARLLAEGHDIEHGVMFAEATIFWAIPGLALPREVLREAIRLWPESKRRQARTDAVREMARRLRCDRPSLMTMLRQARGRIAARRALRRKQRRTT